LTATAFQRRPDCVSYPLARPVGVRRNGTGITEESEDVKMEAQPVAQKSDLKIGLTGFGIALVWLFIVAAVSYWLAIR
jgi:hypothetical protein